MLYPFKMTPVFKEVLWGGSNLKNLFGKAIPSERTGESWEAAAHPNGESRISNGFLAGKTLNYIVQKYPGDFLGAKLKRTKKFPLLFKLIDAREKLSVQVHPDNCTAKALERGGEGKTEMWYIISAAPDAKLICGVNPGVGARDFKKALSGGRLGEVLRSVPVKAGDALFIPAGTVHAIGEGIVIAELQQNSDITYRVFDWDRVDSEGNARELHVDKALRAVSVEARRANPLIEGLAVERPNAKRVYLAASKYFAMEKVTAEKNITERQNGRSFHILFFLQGEGKIIHGNGQEFFAPGDTFVIPACMGNYSVSPGIYLKMYVPDLCRGVKRALLRNGFTKEDFAKVGGLGGR